ncbi:hypothetical protein BC828DRAFT_417883, partial [Blastocladiella britannica]
MRHKWHVNLPEYAADSLTQALARCCLGFVAPTAPSVLPIEYSEIPIYLSETETMILGLGATLDPDNDELAVRAMQHHHMVYYHLDPNTHLEVIPSPKLPLWYWVVQVVSQSNQLFSGGSGLSPFVGSMLSARVTIQTDDAHHCGFQTDQHPVWNLSGKERKRLRNNNQHKNGTYELPSIEQKTLIKNRYEEVWMRILVFSRWVHRIEEDDDGDPPMPATTCEHCHAVDTDTVVLFFSSHKSSRQMCRTCCDALHSELMASQAPDDEGKPMLMCFPRGYEKTHLAAEQFLQGRLTSQRIFAAHKQSPLLLD